MSTELTHGAISLRPEERSASTCALRHFLSGCNGEQQTKQQHGLRPAGMADAAGVVRLMMRSLAEPRDVVTRRRSKLMWIRPRLPAMSTPH